MSASLVGSEMCIRDRTRHRRPIARPHFSQPCSLRSPLSAPHVGCLVESPVSYTHLTLPTICSV
eukprot:8581674-Alexandrium_andersonii.AAC.1